MAPKPFDWKPAYLAALRELPVLKHACAAAGVDRTTAWRAREADAAFAEAEREAMEDGIDKAEAEAFRRGAVGFEEPLVYQGRIMWRYDPVFDPDGEPVIDELTGTQKYAPALDPRGQPIPQTIRKYSDALLSLVLKGRRKKVYSDRTEITGAEGGPLQVDEATRSARVAQLLALAERRKAQADEFGDLA